MLNTDQTDLLFAAIKAKKLPAISAAIALGAVLNSENINSHSPIEAAIISGSAGAVSILLAAGCVIRNPGLALHYAVEVGSFAILQKVLDNISPKALAEIKNTYTPLMHAVKLGRLNMCRLLLASGAIASPNKGGHGPVNFVFSKKFSVPVKRILGC
jgi:ankyrin repeat protein